MIGIIIGTHGNLGEEMLKSCEMICGEQKNVRTVSFSPNQSAEELTASYQKALLDFGTAKDEVIFLNDIFGGTPHNTACRLAMQDDRFGVVTGVSLPMLIELVSIQVSDEDLHIKDLIEKAKDAGRNGAQTFHASFVADEEEDELE